MTAVREITSKPFSKAAPGILSGYADVGLYYAFNLDNPDGVKLLNLDTYERLVSLVRSNGPPSGSSGVDCALFDHGLIKINGRYSARQDIINPRRSLSVWLNVIDACNLGCFYCYIPELQKSIDPSKLGLPKLGINTESAVLIAQRLEEYCSLHGLEHLHIKFAGGEPTLLMEEIDSFCTRLKATISKTRVTFGVLSNGVFNFDTVMPVLQRHKIAVSISIDGMQSNHDKIRFYHTNKERIGTWDRIVDNASRLKESGIAPYFLYTVTAKNLSDIESFAEFASGSGSGFRLSLERGRALVDFGRQRETAEYLIGFYSRFARNAPLTIRLDRDAKFAEWTLDRQKTLACGTCRGYVAIDRVGRVASCQMRLDEPMADMHEKSLTEAFSRFGDDTRTRKLRRPEEREGGCTHCEYRFVCAGGCPQHTRELWGDADQPSPWCFVYGSLLPRYIEATGIHLARRVRATGRHIG